MAERNYNPQMNIKDDKQEDEGMDETTFLSSNPANKAMLIHSVEQDKNGESITVVIPEA